jgi:hypothetical protein
MSSKVRIICPSCGSADVIYSCEPKCCFNHVCADCRTTFEPVTKLAAGTRWIQPPDPLPDSTEPTVACCRCESIAVYVDDDGAIVCTSCGSLLEMELTEIVQD